MSEYQTDPSPIEEVSPLAMAMGIGCLVLALPAVVIGLMELIDALDHGVLTWTVNSILYTSSSVLILVGSGLWLMGVLKTDLAKMSVAIPLIGASFFSMIRRFSAINEDLHVWTGESFIEALDYPWVHEQMELSFLGILIGIIIMTK